MSTPPPPPALRRVGLLRAETNKAPHQRLILPPKAIVNAFGDELLKRLIAKQNAQEQETTPCESQ